MKDERLRMLAAKAGLPWWVNIDDPLLGESLERFARIVEEEKEKQMDQDKESARRYRFFFALGAVTALVLIVLTNLFGGPY